MLAPLAVVALVGAFALAAMVLQALGQPRQPTFWEGIYRPDALVEVEQYRSVREMTRAADVVVVGRIVEVTPGREFGEGTDIHHYAAAHVEILEVLVGDVPLGGQLIWELPLVPGQRAAEAEALNASLPQEPLLLFLRNKATEVLSGSAIGDAAVEAGFYRTVVSGAVLADVAGRVRLPITPHESEFLNELDGRAFGELIAIVRRDH